MPSRRDKTPGLRDPAPAPFGGNRRDLRERRCTVAPAADTAELPRGGVTLGDATPQSGFYATRRRQARPIGCG